MLVWTVWGCYLSRSFGTGVKDKSAFSLCVSDMSKSDYCMLFDSSSSCELLAQRFQSMHQAGKQFLQHGSQETSSLSSRGVGCPRRCSRLEGLPILLLVAFATWASVLSNVSQLLACMVKGCTASKQYAENKIEVGFEEVYNTQLFDVNYHVYPYFYHHFL